MAPWRLPQAGQAAAFATLSVRNCIVSASTASSRPASRLPAPLKNLSASVAYTVPRMPTTLPSTPASSPEGTSPAGGSPP